MMTPLRRTRLETNTDSYSDIALTGTIDGDVLTVASIQNGELEIGSALFGAPLASTWDDASSTWDGGVSLWDATDAPIAPGTTVAAFGTGTGLTGTYTVTPAQTRPYAPIYAGVTSSMQPTEVVIQLDIFGPRSAEHAQIVSTLMRDEFATHYFDNAGLDLQSLYADDPRQMPFIDAETQYEWRWIVEAHLQANMTVKTPLQFADRLHVDLIPADASCADELLNPDAPPLVMVDANGSLILVPCLHTIV